MRRWGGVVRRRTNVVSQSWILGRLDQGRRLFIVWRGKKQKMMKRVSGYIFASFSGRWGIIAASRNPNSGLCPNHIEWLQSVFIKHSTVLRYSRIDYSLLRLQIQVCNRRSCRMWQHCDKNKPAFETMPKSYRMTPMTLYNAQYRTAVLP